VLDEYEGADFFVMTMEKHGSGVDLFEFIETASSITEPLASYIFRQVGGIVCYHSRTYVAVVYSVWINLASSNKTVYTIAVYCRLS